MYNFRTFSIISECDDSIVTVVVVVVVVTLVIIVVLICILVYLYRKKKLPWKVSIIRLFSLETVQLRPTA